MAYRHKPMPPELVMELRRMFLWKELRRLNKKVAPGWNEWSDIGARLERDKRDFEFSQKHMTARRNALWDELHPTMVQIGILEKEVRSLNVRIRNAEKKAKLALQEELGG